MQSQNRFFDDLARVASGAAGALAGVRAEMEEAFRQKLERYLAEADMVPRDEFDAIKAVAVKAREAQEGLEARVVALEAEIATIKKPAPRNSSKKSAPKTPD
jgi:BMFP domain-containing protein YqiC